jgi:hypothetical protein
VPDVPDDEVGVGEAGADVVGADVVGAEVVGADVPAADVVGADVLGAGADEEPGEDEGGGAGVLEVAEDAVTVVMSSAGGCWPEFSRLAHDHAVVLVVPSANE